MCRLQPETLRLLVESGQDNTPIVYRPLVPLIGRQTPRQGNLTNATHRSSIKARVPKNPLRIFLNPDIIVLLWISAVPFAVFYGFIAPFPVLLQHSYPFLSEADIGLCFLSIGAGTIVGSIVMGKILDKEYARFNRNETGLNWENDGTQRAARERLDIVNDGIFPLEVVRAIHSWLFN
jgi:hypothetical protein